MPFDTAVEMELLSQEVNDYSMMDECEIPRSVREAADSGDSKLKADIIWHHLSCVRRPDGQKHFRSCQRLRCWFSLHAEEERVFSMIKQNKTAFRSSLDQEETLGSIVTIKMEMANQKSARPEGYPYQFPPAVLSDAKKATRKYNKAHSN